MSDMIERVARVMVGAMTADDDSRPAKWEDVPEENKVKILSMACAAINEVRAIIDSALAT